MSSIHNKRELSERRIVLRKNQTRAESILWNCLRANRFEGIKFKRQHSIEWYITDFYCAAKKLVIEVDGDSHFIGNAQEYDFTRTKLLNALDINVVRFRNDEIYNDLENVLDRIKTFISTSPSLPLQRGGE